MSSTNEFGQPVGCALPDWRNAKLPPRAPLSGRFCRVEPLDPERHGKELYEANALDRDARHWTYLPYGPFESFESYRGWLAGCLGDDPLFFAIVDSALGRAVGVASLLRVDPQSGSIEVGHLRFSSLLQRKPAATESMFLLMQLAFDCGYRRYEWKCDALNAPSRAAAQRLGFRFEGVFRQTRVNKGHNRDTAWFSITDREWPELARAFERWLDPANFDPHGHQRVRLSELTRAAQGDS